MPTQIELPEDVADLQTRGLYARASQFTPRTLDRDSRSFEAVVASETRALVFDYRSYEVIEEILLARGGRFPAKIPLLANHRRYDLLDVIGSAVDFRLEGDRWIGRGVVAEPADANDPVERIWRRVADGHLSAVSIGYSVSAYEDIQRGKRKEIDGVEYAAGERTLRISTAWEVKELSLTPIGADSSALIRSFPGHGPQKKGYFAK